MSNQNKPKESGSVGSEIIEALGEFTDALENGTVSKMKQSKVGLDVILIAKTKPHECADDGESVWWKEWQARRVSDDAWILEQRYLIKLADGQILCKTDREAVPEDAWEAWQFGGSLREAIDEGLGDSSFFDAVSLSAVHAKLVKELTLVKAAADEAYKAEKEYDAAASQLSEFKNDQLRKFNKAHGDKTGEDWERAKARTLKRIGPMLDQLKTASQEKEAAWQAAKAKLEALRSSGQASPENKEMVDEDESKR